MVEEKACAKINIALEVMDTVDGYHKVNNIMIPIHIFDYLTLTKADSIEIKNDPFPGENIITKAAKLFFDYTKINGGVYIELEKNIPHAAGLAGGSTDAAATLKGLNKLYNTNLTNDELKELGGKLGSDVPFFIEGKPALCTNRGEIINPLESNLDKFPILLIKPNTGLSTAAVYKNYVYNNESKKDKLDNLIKALANNDLKLLKDNIFNDLGAVALSLNSDMKAIYDKISALGYKVYISGSGPTMYILDFDVEDMLLLKNKLPKETFVMICHSI